MSSVVYVPNTSISAAEEYEDLSQDMAGYNEIKYLNQQEIIQGYPDGEFKPYEPVSRAEAAIMLTRALDLSTKNRPNPHLKDVPQDHPRYKYIATVVEEGIYQGTDSNEFEPGKAIQRIEMATVLTRAYNLKNGPVGTDFRDVEDNHEYIKQIASNRISVGYPDQTFRPFKHTTRSQFSIFLARTMDKQFRNPTLKPSFLDSAREGEVQSCFAAVDQTITYNDIQHQFGEPEEESTWGGELKADYGKCSYLFNPDKPNQMKGLFYYPMDERLTSDAVLDQLSEQPDQQKESNDQTYRQIYKLKDYTVYFVYPSQGEPLDYIYIKPNTFYDPTWLLKEKYFNDMETVNGTLTITNPSNPLVLVNKEHYLPSDYVPELTRPNVQFVFGDQELNKALMRPEAARHLEDMFKAASRAGINILATSGYRSYDRQQYLFQQEVEESGREEAKTVVAIPGTSEHQTGLTMDITSPSVDYGLVERFGETEEGRWLANHAYKYGFILRYPEGKENVTGYQYEPWHFRYVGEKYAKIIHEHNITLETYFDSVTKY